MQSTDQSAKSAQLAGAESSASQVDPTNTNLSVRVLSPGDNGNVSQSNSVDLEGELVERQPHHADHQAGSGRQRRVRVQRRQIRSRPPTSPAGASRALWRSRPRLRPAQRTAPCPSVSAAAATTAASSSRTRSAPTRRRRTRTGPTRRSTRISRADRVEARFRPPTSRRSTVNWPGRCRPQDSAVLRTTHSPVRVGSRGGGGSVDQSNSAESDARARRTATAPLRVPSRISRRPASAAAAATSASRCWARRP